MHRLAQWFMLPTSILQWALYTVVCNFQTEFQLGQWGQPACIWHDNLLYTSSVYNYIYIHFRTWQPCHHPCNPQTHGHSWPMRQDACPPCKMCGHKKFHPNQPSWETLHGQPWPQPADPVYLENIPWEVTWAKLQIDTGESALWSQNANKNSKEGIAKKNADQINSSTTDVAMWKHGQCWQLLLLGLWVQWLLRPTLLKWLT